MSFAERLRNLLATPLANLRWSFWWVRKTFFTKPRSTAPSLVVPLSTEETTRLLGQHYFDPGWELSYHYRGEVLYLRRVEYVEHSSGVNWWQIHLRGYDHPDGLELAAHFETEPSENPDAHIELFGLDVERGMKTLREVLDELGVEYDQLDNGNRVAR